MLRCIRETLSLSSSIILAYSNISSFLQFNLFLYVGVQTNPIIQIPYGHGHFHLFPVLCKYGIDKLRIQVITSYRRKHISLYIIGRLLYKTGENYAYLGLPPHFLIFDEYVAFMEIISMKFKKKDKEFFFIVDFGHDSGEVGKVSVLRV